MDNSVNVQRRQAVKLLHARMRAPPAPSPSSASRHRPTLPISCAPPPIASPTSGSGNSTNRPGNIRPKARRGPWAHPRHMASASTETNSTPRPDTPTRPTRNQGRQTHNLAYITGKRKGTNSQAPKRKTRARRINRQTHATKDSASTPITNRTAHRAGRNRCRAPQPSAGPTATTWS